jgi:hypothetical protein
MQTDVHDCNPTATSLGPGDSWRCRVCGQMWISKSVQDDLEINRLVWIRKEDSVMSIPNKPEFAVGPTFTGNSSVTIQWSDGSASPIDDLLKRELGPAIALFRSKARDYSERSGIFTADLLGSQGQFAEIWRKIPKLKKGMWDGEVLENESVREILQDIVGHCLLALDFDAQESPTATSEPADKKIVFTSPGSANTDVGILVSCTGRHECPPPLGSGDKINGPAGDFGWCPIHNSNGFM